MGFYTDWFIADKADAEKIASIVTTEEYDFDDWPHLSMKNIGVVELGLLWERLAGDELDPGLPTFGESLFEGDEEDLFVFELASEYIAVLASVQPDQVPGISAQWYDNEELSAFSLEEVTELLQEIVSFTQQAKQMNKPILELATI
ncbi:hypothetical protein [Marinobacterium jannaschii]|uniref:hypothetical protein n=1 Tax=Marinobacterium jannaschii TaxID=64970 RepID=UPI000481646E|nr:hypothetical protein [Marinobacterium jannaschii]